MEASKNKEVYLKKLFRPRGKESTKVRITQNKGKEMEKLLPKIEEISNGKTHTNTRKIN